ncbi:two-component system sensor histidine kinase NtrB [Thiohalorhabdus denitrificans]|uniref:histidine kinase n=1 Tax=Thiohalorhabdus denitrificans TaxID=381306 RepID=A0A1G5APZ8_9GAMM|nr:ATP-binding protein [Thiohalorhabdus denitrificans]SCX79977.1 PAS domain S-box-containing protein [Thiohalorhabdus denitrificans]
MKELFSRYAGLRAWWQEGDSRRRISAGVLLLLGVGLWAATEVRADGLAGASLLSVLGLAILVTSRTRSDEVHREARDEALRALHDKIAEAKEGCLQPVEVGTLGDLDPRMSRMVSDYNRMIENLRSTFNYVEECQNKVLAERNKTDALLQSLPGALISVDENLVITTVNKQAEEIMEGPAEALIGQNLFELLDLNEADRCILRDAFLYKRPVRNQEIALTIGQEPRAVSINLSFLSREDTDMAAVVTLQDITEYKRLQESVYTREKLVAMGQLAAGVAHELNTPLGNILGYSQLMQESLDDPERLAHYSGVVVEEAKQCSRIVQDLLNYARKDQCVGETCGLNALIGEVNDTFLNCRLKRFKVDLETELDPGIPEVEGGCGELDIVFTNLILNAIQALKGVDNPQVRIRTWEEPNGMVGASVEDNGPGIPPEIRSRVFDPFFTTKDVGAGSGLGLAISQAMLSKRGGYIMYDADYADGARFILRLPSAKAHEASD